MYHADERITTGVMAVENDILNIRLHVYDTDLSVRIKREDEFFYREAAKMITSRVSTYSELYKGRKSDKEVMYMAMIDIALRYQKNKDANDTSAINDILDKLTTEIEEAL